MNVHRIDSFHKGMIRDASLVETEPVMRTVKNYRYIYDGDRVTLKVRKGFDAFNSTELSADRTATQLFVYRDLENNENVLAITYRSSDTVYNKWYQINSSGSSVKISDEVATARQPAMTCGGRFFFGTDGSGLSDIGWRWADNSSIAAGESYRVGIKKPTEPPTMRNTIAGIGQVDDGDGPGLLTGYANDVMIVGSTDERYVATKFVLTEETAISAINIALGIPNPLTTEGNLRISIYTEDAAAPSDTLADDNAISGWVPVSSITGGGGYSYVAFYLQDVITLSAGSYWIVLQGDGAYRAMFNITGAAATHRFVGIDYRDPGATPVEYGLSLYSADKSSWAIAGLIVGGMEMRFYLGGQTDTYYYDYIITYCNSTYGIESRPSDKIRIQFNAGYTIVMTNYPVPTDDQVDRIRLYRRTVGTDVLTVDADITDTYKFVGQVTLLVNPTVIYDMLDDDSLGAEIQTLDHYCFDDVDDAGEELRDSALVPHVTCTWKDRIWFAEEDSNILYFSKLLEEDGRTGWTGKAAYDFFPLDNKHEMPVSSGIIALRQLSDDALTIYFKNGEVWVLEGGNDIYNPPSDLSRRQVLFDTGLLAPAGIDDIRGRHVYLAQEGVFSFAGTSDPVFLSQEVQSILDAVETAYLDDSIVTCFGEEVWLLFDSDNDGALDQILVLNILRSTPTWRLYDYGKTFTDIVVRPTGSTFKTVLAADATDGYVWELETGTTDNGLPIETEGELHKLRVQKRLTITGAELDGSYPGTPARYQVEVTEHNGNVSLYSIEPTSSDDVRGHRTGCRVTTGPTAKVTIKGRSVNEDELLSIAIEYEDRR